MKVKRYLTLVLAIVLALSLVACGATTEKKSNDTKSVSSKVEQTEKTEPVVAEPTEETPTEDVSAAVSETEPPETSGAVLENDVEDTSDEGGLRSDFKEAMDSYEAFIDEYCEFMQAYSENSSDLKLLAQYASYMSKYADFCDKFEKWESEDLNDAELSYYIEVQARSTEKLLTVADIAQ